MTKSLVELYLEWLYDQTQTAHSSRGGKTYWALIRCMHAKAFIWTVPNDDNRVSDALDLRVEFVNYIGEQGIEIGEEGYINSEASFLEVLVGLSRRLAFAADGSSAESWAWQLIENLGLNRMQDPISDRKEVKINDICDQVIWRTYEPSGQGGFFPLAWTDLDMRRVELWYQMNQYLEEQTQL